MNETNPSDTLNLAGLVLKFLADNQASAGEKCAALRTAAFAIEQAANAQQMALVMSNILRKTS